MGLDDLKPKLNSRSARKRVGRGYGSGSGRTAGRGHKGQRSRSGGLPPRGFEGGQMPLHRRVPKRGFFNQFSKDIATINVAALNRFDDGTEITPELLVETGLVKRSLDGVKILGQGELQRKLTVKAHYFSQTALGKIEAAGGTATVI